jgi:hypothetical protein
MNYLKSILSMIPFGLTSQYKQTNVLPNPIMYELKEINPDVKNNCQDQTEPYQIEDIYSDEDFIKLFDRILGI